MSYASIGDITARNPYRAIGASTKPSQSEVEAWISQAEAMLNGALAGAGMTTPYTDSAAVLILRNWVASYVEGLVRMAYAASGGDGANDDGKDLVKAFLDRLDDIAVNAARYDRMLTPSSTADTTTGVRASNLDGALEPEFTRGTDGTVF